MDMTDTAVRNDQESAQTKFTIFRGGGGETSLDHDVMTYEGIDDAMLKGFELTTAAGVGEGQQVRCLFRTPGPNGVSLCHAWFKSGFMLPRHSHDADCIYYIVAGEVHLGGVVLGKGDGFFVPANSAYTYQAGPQGLELLEFRNAGAFNIVFKGNELAFWQKVADAAETARANWPAETAPPTQ